MTPYWIIVPYLNVWEMTKVAIEDFLAQTGLPSPPQVLAIDTGSSREVRAEMEAWMEREPRLHAWFHRPGLPSLSATWNLGLRFVWEQGGEVALVPNNDTRLHSGTYSTLLAAQQATDALFVSAIGRRENDMNWESYFAGSRPMPDLSQRGGPDFSCFLITQQCHQLVQFDERHIPAFFEDNSYHREMMLAGEGHRIFSVAVPYLHYGSATINADPTKRLSWAKRIDQSRAHYIRAWGGYVNAERYTIKFDESTAQDGVTNPELQRRALDGLQRDASCTATPDSPVVD